MNYCTLFDSHYLSRGLAMYQSLIKHCDKFHLYIYAFDDLSYEILKNLELSHATVISLYDFEDDRLLAVKATRTTGEYCWTCTPSVIKFSIEHFGLNSCTYLDADIYFFSDPTVLIEEMGEKSILITEHRYTPKYDQSNTSGIYCVQFMTFKRDANGMEALSWWRESCLEWCYARFENGKFGDQKYLDDWPERFSGVHILQHIGGGVAPWNVQQYSSSKLEDEAIFYHFHGLRFLDKNIVDLGNYNISKHAKEIIYHPYLSHVDEIELNLESAFKKYSRNIAVTNSVGRSWVGFAKTVRRYLRGEYNVYEQGELPCLK